MCTHASELDVRFLGERADTLVALAKAVHGRGLAEPKENARKFVQLGTKGTHAEFRLLAGGMLAKTKKWPCIKQERTCWILNSNGDG